MLKDLVVFFFGFLCYLRRLFINLNVIYFYYKNSFFLYKDFGCNCLSILNGIREENDF